jgi:hypothetical protein
VVGALDRVFRYVRRPPVKRDGGVIADKVRCCGAEERVTQLDFSVCDLDDTEANKLFDVLFDGRRRQRSAEY